MASVHPVRLLNTALVGLRQAPITEAAYNAENLDGTPSSQSVWARRQAFESSLPDVLRSHNWNCITKRAELSEDSDNSPSFGFSRRFLFPSDFVRVTQIFLDNIIYYPTAEGGNFRIEDDEDVAVPSLVTNAISVNLRYVYMPISFTLDGLPAGHDEYSSSDYTVPDFVQTWIGKFDYGLRHAVIDRLKKELAYTLTGSTALERQKEAIYVNSLAEAQYHDSSDSGLVEIDILDDISEVRR